MKVAELAIDRLVNAPRNANKMTPQRYALLVDSIRRIGFVQHILVRALDDEAWEIVDGHHRRDAMRDLGNATIPSIVLEGGEDPRLVALAMNRLRGETDLATASVIIEELVAEAFSAEDLAISGFTERELQELVEALDSPDDPQLEDLEGAEVPQEVGADVARPYLLDLTFRTKEDLSAARKALRKAAGKGGDIADGLLRLIRGES